MGGGMELRPGARVERQVIDGKNQFTKAAPAPAPAGDDPAFAKFFGAAAHAAFAASRTK